MKQWKTVVLDYTTKYNERLLTGFGMLVFTNINYMEFQVIYLALFLLFWIIDGFDWFWMESFLRNIQLMLKFLKAPFLVLRFSYNTLMTFLTMLSVILLSMLMILNSVLSVIRHLICGKTWIGFWTWIWSTRHLWSRVKSYLLISMLGKLSWFSLTVLITMVLLMKWFYQCSCGKIIF